VIFAITLSAGGSFTTLYVLIYGMAFFSLYPYPRTCTAADVAEMSVRVHQQAGPHIVCLQMRQDSILIVMTSTITTRILLQLESF
jgi:hypothetical protein